MGGMPINLNRRTLLKAIGGSAAAPVILGEQISAQDPEGYPESSRWRVHFAAKLQQELNKGAFTAIVRSNPDGTWRVHYTNSGNENNEELANQVRKITRTFLKNLQDRGDTLGTLNAYVLSEDGTQEVAHWVVDSQDILRIVDQDVTNSERISAVLNEYEDEFFDEVFDEFKTYGNYSENFVTMDRMRLELTNFLNDNGIKSHGYTSLKLHRINLFYTTQSPPDASLDSELVRTEINVIAYAYAAIIQQSNGPIPHLMVRIQGEEYFYRGGWFLNAHSPVMFNDGDYSEEDYENSIYTTIEPFRFKCHPTVC